MNFLISSIWVITTSFIVYIFYGIIMDLIYDYFGEVGKLTKKDKFKLFLLVLILVFNIVSGFILMIK